VKIRGIRIEPGEIEACLMTHPAVARVCVVASEDSKGVYRLIAYVVGSPVDASELREHLLKSLPDYIAPSAFVFIDELPLTRNGKIDRSRLPVPDIDAMCVKRYVAPSNETEELLCEIWADTLKVSRVGVEDNFFELGGHSLLVIQARSRIQRAFDIDLPLRSFFESPTVAKLARRLEEILIAELESLDEGVAQNLRSEMQKPGDLAFAPATIDSKM
jgi:acyl carrier protein